MSKRENPGIRISNFEKMLQMKGFNKVGFALVPETKPKRVYLLEYRKMSLAGIKAAEMRKKTRYGRTSSSTRSCCKRISQRLRGINY